MTRSCFLLAALAGGFIIPAPTQAQVPGRCEARATQHPAEVGCYLLDSMPIGHPPAKALFWHIYNFPSLVDAKSSRATTGVAVEAYGKSWLFTIAPRDWRPAAGKQVAVLGPLAATSDRIYTAHYAQSTLVPGLQTLVHRHPGPEVFFVLDGSQCVESMYGKKVTKAGESAMLPGGTWMQLRHYGTDTLRSILLILHESEQPLTDRTPTEEWKPQDLCAS
jgi:mannose-6-phosphate isomerase-like protein (cupin superfamily)